MKTTHKMIRTLAILMTLALGLSGCFATSGEKMMDDSMTAPMVTMEKDTMNETMTPQMNTMNKDTMAPPMETMEKSTMGSQSDTMK